MNETRTETLKPSISKQLAYASTNEILDELAKRHTTVVLIIRNVTRATRIPKVEMKWRGSFRFSVEMIQDMLVTIGLRK